MTRPRPRAARGRRRGLAESTCKDLKWASVFSVYRRPVWRMGPSRSLMQASRTGGGRIVGARIELHRRRSRRRLRTRSMRQFETAEQEIRRGLSPIAPDRADAYDKGAPGTTCGGTVQYCARGRVLESAPSLDSPFLEDHLDGWSSIRLRPQAGIGAGPARGVSDRRCLTWQTGYVPKHLLECICLSDMGEGKVRSV